MSNQRPIRQRVRTAADEARRDLYLWSKALQSAENTYRTRDSLLKRGGPLPDVVFHLSLEDIKRIEDETALRLIRWSEDLDGHEVCQSAFNRDPLSARKRDPLAEMLGG
jgi:hypothetical protein